MSHLTGNSKSSIPLVIVLLGATGVGKSSLIEKFSDRFSACRIEIINADSRQVYRFLDIGTAKPSQQVRAKLPHHLVDIINPDIQFTVADFVEKAENLVSRSFDNGKISLVVGGSAFYLWSLVNGLSETPPADLVVRGKLLEQAETKGIEFLHDQLKDCDPITASMVPKTNKHRIIRALEVYKLSGKPLSEFKVNKTMRRDFLIKIIGIRRDREQLYSRINRRVDQMFIEGLSEEVKILQDKGWTSEMPGLQSIGYSEFFVLKGRSENEIKDLIKRNSRRYAKRQLTFFQRFVDVVWLEASSGEAIIVEIEKIIERYTN